MGFRFIKIYSKKLIICLKKKLLVVKLLWLKVCNLILNVNSFLCIFNMLCICLIMYLCKYNEVIVINKISKMFFIQKIKIDLSCKKNYINYYLFKYINWNLILINLYAMCLSAKKILHNFSST